MSNSIIHNFKNDLKKICKSNKHDIALFDSINNSKISYGNLWKEISKLNYFFKKKFNKDDIAISCLDNSLSTLNLFLCFSAFGYKYYPLSSDITVDEYKSYVGSYTPKHIIVSNSTNLNLINYFRKEKIKTININKLAKIKKTSAQSLNKKANLILNTSGTTGLAKKIYVDINKLWSSGKNFSNNYKFLNENSTIINYLPMSYLGGLFNLCLIPLSKKCKIVITEKFSGKTFFNIWSLVKKYNVNILWLVPSILKGLIKFYSLYQNHNDTKKIKIDACFLGTAPIKIQDKIKFQKLFKTLIYENYGTSETTFISVETKNNKLEKQNYVGKLLSHIKIKKNIKQSLTILSPYNFDGYIEDLSDKPKKEIYFDTGDVFKLTNKNFLKIIGRTKEIIKKGGNLIPLRQMSNILENHHNINEAMAKKINHEFYGEDYNLFYTSETKREIKDIEEWFKNKVSHLKYPNKILFVKKFKKTESGKIKI